jgi:hypothetical protein
MVDLTVLVGLMSHVEKARTIGDTLIHETKAHHMLLIVGAGTGDQGRIGLSN